MDFVILTSTPEGKVFLERLKYMNIFDNDKLEKAEFVDITMTYAEIKEMMGR